MTERNGRDHLQEDPIEQAKRVVEELQDKILALIDSCAKEHSECSPEAFPVAVGQAFVAQCLKTYGEQGFEEARKHTQLIVEAMEAAFHDEAGEL